MFILPNIIVLSPISRYEPQHDHHQFRSIFRHANDIEAALHDAFQQKGFRSTNFLLILVIKLYDIWCTGSIRLLFT